MAETSKDAAPFTAAKTLDSARGSRAGLFYGISAYSMWGIFPVYFRAVSHVPPVIVLCHRILWSAVFLGLLVSIRGEWKLIWPVLRSRRNILLLSASAVLIALNWLVFIYAVASKQVLQASLGYFLNPLLSIVLGMVFLRERLRGWQWLATAIAMAGVANLALLGTGFPWLALSLAATFGFFGLARKKVDINSLHGLLVETAVLLPVAAVTLAVLPVEGESAATWGLLSLSGIITPITLLFFGAALRRLKLTTIGFLQYLGPSLQFLVAVCLFHEPLDRVKLNSFALCWLAVAVYSVDSLVNRRPQVVADEPE